ncbi:cell division protein FtsL [Virgibacillus dokdonensis]|uniref:Cell division protein FtsL n=2 Tax=Virgibacillus TaxID=84406 RepID=A0A2K9J4A3_9BACI|nr:MULTISPECIES: cell division protein FtsL [Virgibacillus]AUJ26778.1 Cell division protein FtsL [Virgibacillus dokdonensis]NWO12774.1 cell division protein FtsL [Virgibacillus sp.]RFA37622.1 cell division protein FtsL [Virgibacillus dokdonensis]SHG88130.1 cell division protein FtsL [Virgibacillus chiguensis]
MSANHARSWEQLKPQKTQEQSVPVKVTKQGWITKGEKIIYSLIGLIIIAASIYMVSFTSSTDSINREMQELENKVKVQQSENDLLKDEINSLSRPERIIDIAKKNGFQVQDAKVKQAKSIDE